MLIFKVVETIHRIGPKKGQKAYNAVQKAPMSSLCSGSLSASCAKHR